MRELRNDPHIQQYLLEQVYITEEQQRAYMEKNEKHYHICLCDDEPAGYIGVKDNEVGLVVATQMQGRGIGRFMLTKIRDMHPGCYARIKDDNIASIRLFESCGYKFSHKTDNILYMI